MQEEAQRKRAARQPTAWDMLHELVNGADGSFARAYVNLKAHEHGCFGRQMTVDVPCYNEWALEKDSHVVNSVRSKRGTHAGPIRKPPYVVGKLELQLLYVPKPKGAADEQMPKSMSSAVREMGKAREVKEIVHEGCLSQQGGDCAVSQALLQTKNIDVIPHTDMMITTALAPPLLPPPKLQTHRLPRAHAAETRRHQPRQGLPPRRRQDHPRRGPDLSQP